MNSSAKKKFLSPEVLAEGAYDIAVIAKRQGERVALVGGYALQLYNSPRLTGDLDVLSEHPLNELPEKKDSALTFGGYQTVTPSKVPVDIIIRADDYAPLYETALSFAGRMRGVPLLVVQLEYILAMKYAIDRPRDHADVEFIIAYTKVNIEKATTIIRKFLGIYAAHEFQAHVKVTMWKKSQGMLDGK